MFQRYNVTPPAQCSMHPSTQSMSAPFFHSLNYISSPLRMQRLLFPGHCFTPLLYCFLYLDYPILFFLLLTYFAYDIPIQFHSCCCKAKFPSSLKVEQHSIVHICHIFFTHPSVKCHFVYFQVLAIVSSTAVSISFRICIFMVEGRRVETEVWNYSIIL